MEGIERSVQNHYERVQYALPEQRSLYVWVDPLKLLCSCSSGPQQVITGYLVYHTQPHPFRLISLHVQYVMYFCAEGFIKEINPVTVRKQRRTTREVLTVLYEGARSSTHFKGHFYW